MGTLDRIRGMIHRATAPTHVRRFDAAAGGRRGSGLGWFGRTSTEVSAAATTVRSRARYLATNNPLIVAAVDNWVGSLVGTGIVPTGDEAAVARFTEWAAAADADGRTDLFGLQAEIARALVVDGEAFVHLVETDTGLKLRLIPAEMVDESRTANLDGGAYVVNGVRFNADGTRAGYWVLPAKPTDQFATYAAPVFVPASDMLHVFKPIGVGQVRGISWLAPIVVPANELDGILDALAVGVRIAALHAGFLVDLGGNGAPFDGESDLSNVSLEPGTVRRLPQGFDIKFSTPQQAQQTADFVKAQIRLLAAGLGLPSHMVDGDLAGANYSSLRAGLLPFRTRVEQIQYGILVPQLLTPVWRRVQGHAVLSGEADAVPPVEWLPPAFLQVDPQKAVEADVAELAAGLTSRRKLAAARGWNVADLDREIAADREREAALGLSFGQTAPAASEQPATAQKDVEQ